MPLPEIITPEFQTILPSTGETIFYRPFLVKEEKMLLMAQEGKDKLEITNAVIQILQNCMKTPVEINKLPLFDVEWLFLQLRSKSVGEVITLNLRHNKEGCQHLNKVELPIEKIIVNKTDDHSNILMIDEESGLGVTLNYPTLEVTQKFNVENHSNKDIFDLMLVCIKNVFDKEQVYNDFTMEELSKFVGELPKEFVNKVMKFFNTMPRVGYKLEYECEKCKDKITHELNGLMDFFL
jgi:predicted Mrr-cat superfamily restriction endonuclease